MPAGGKEIFGNAVSAANGCHIMKLTDTAMGTLSLAIDTLLEHFEAVVFFQ